MDIQTEKLKLIQWIAEQDDPGIIKKILDLKAANEVDWWDQISEAEKNEIKQGLEEADNDELTPHEEVKTIYKQWHSK